MAVWTIAKLTVTEAIRRRTLAGAAILGVLILCLTLVLLWIRADMVRLVSSGIQDHLWLAVQFPIRRSVITSLTLGSIRIFGSLLAVFVSVGALPADLDSGTAALFVSRGISRRRLFVGRLLGMLIVVCGSVFLWSVTVFLSLSLQSREPLWPILQASPYLALYPALIGVVGMTMSACMPRFQAMALTLGISAIAWMDGILNGLGDLYSVSWLHRLAVMAALFMPQGSVAHWIKRAIEEINYTEPALSITPESPEPMREWGLGHGIAHLDAVYVFGYMVVIAFIGAAVIQRRDV
jgi:ABC-type transport system involved in multi-copper enzyme maturation permease subunit